MKNTELWAYDALKQKAEDLVREKIKGSRKGLLNEPNYLHSFRVRDIVMQCHHWDDGDYDLFLAALLHDVVEDGGVSLEELERLGFSDQTIRYVELCTHPMDVKNHTERWVLMLAKIIEAKDVDVWRIKMADLTDNLSQSKGLTPENRKFMIETKAPILLRLTEGGFMLQAHRNALEIEMQKQRKEANESLI